MKYRYTALYVIRGFSLPTSEKDKELIIDSKIGLRAILSSQPNPYVAEGDRSLAIANLLLQAIFRSEPTSEEFKHRVLNAFKEIRDEREKKFGNGPYLVIIGEGETLNFTPSNLRDAEDFVVCFDGADKSEIRTRFQPNITALINSIASIEDSVVSISKVTDSVVFFQEDSKPIYSYTPLVGSPRVIVSKPLQDEQLRLIGELYNLFVEDINLQRVQRLIRSSFETEEDGLRSFLAAWSAFEFFVNKSFKIYENRFFNSLLEEGHPEVQRKYLERIREVMKDKYRLADRFATISFQLSPSSADEDLKIVLQVKKIRDELTHGETVDEAQLPVKSIRDLTSKYLRLHISHISQEKT